MWVMGAVIYWAPVAVVVMAANQAQKRTGWVIGAGALAGWIGAGLVALILPPLSDEEWAAYKNPPRDADADDYTMRVVWIALGVLSVILVGGLAALNLAIK